MIGLPYSEIEVAKKYEATENGKVLPNSNKGNGNRKTPSPTSQGSPHAEVQSTRRVSANR